VQRSFTFGGAPAAVTSFCIVITCFRKAASLQSPVVLLFIRVLLFCLIVVPFKKNWLATETFQLLGGKKKPVSKQKKQGDQEHSSEITKRSLSRDKESGHEKRERQNFPFPIFRKIIACSPPHPPPPTLLGPTFSQ
jgi:hypothetical protein